MHVRSQLAFIIVGLSLLSLLTQHQTHFDIRLPRSPEVWGASQRPRRGVLF
jgi:hypothetical protein